MQALNDGIHAEDDLGARLVLLHIVHKDFIEGLLAGGLGAKVQDDPDALVQGITGDRGIRL